MTFRAAVIGASGYTGAEVLRLVAGHPEMDVVYVTADSNAGARVADLYPSLGAAYPGLTYSSFNAVHLGSSDVESNGLDGIDVAFMALPHGASQRSAAVLASRVAHIVDIGSDFRLPADQYEHWYGEAHTAPDLIGSFAYGLPELFRKTVLDHPHVANPGCYPTAASLALAPLVANSLVEPTGIVVNAVSGVSGRGRGLSAPSLFSEANENVSAYGLLTHRHTAEMELALSAVSSSGPVQVLFTPHLVPMTRGILATCYARPTQGSSTDGLLELYRDFYTGEPFVAVLDTPPATKPTYGSNAVHVTVRADARTGTILAIAAEDNLVKGASGQALQNANLLLGLPETLGLTNIGVV